MNRIVLITPKSFHCWSALNMGYLSSWAKKYCPKEVKTIDFFSGFFDDDKTIFEACDKADIVGITATSPQWKEACRYGAEIKRRNPEAWLVVGGFHPSALPEDCAREPWVGSVVQGEGERSFQAIIEGCRAKFVSRPKIEDLDCIPPPDRACIKFARQLERSQRLFGERMGDMFTSRGCPFACVFCASRTVWGRKQRTHSPSRVVHEMKDLKERYAVDWIAFSDDEFGINPRYAEEFIHAKEREAPEIGWGCNMVATSVVRNPEIIEGFRRVNCRRIWLGVESGSPRIMQKLGKGLTREKVIEAFRIVKENGIEARAYFLLGMPGETSRDIDLTKNLATQINADSVGFTILCPYPGSGVFRKEHSSLPWDQMDEFGNRFWRNESLSNEDLRLRQRLLAEEFKDRLTWHQTVEEEVNPAMKGDTENV